MQTFFQSLSDIERYLEPCHRYYSLTCQHCGLGGHLISHGFIYKQLSMHERKTIGKRVVCSNRYGHSGCGRTTQLVLAECVPNRQYSAWQLSVFIVLLLTNVAVVKAYQQATKQVSTRQAWRWVAALKRNIMQYRLRLKSPVSVTSSWRCTHPVFATLCALVDDLTAPVCLAFQLSAQTAFI
ncbi:hypothetical protein C2869_06865 [Saccharobesus litoralis]|uniref:Uncharacterized protein n=1 Tax=Saccharobesus litoralis TaxID=2172099 RepID=A0A2S0VPP0_9ALTE|nr:hypothetical protein [Saccharobesus litoralis]AWB66174.1 hypothetical protein C2869_06865 [Saccharobesus litoralis]